MPYLSLPTLDEYTHAKWELVLTSGGVELDIDLISASFNINNGDVNNPFNLNCNNTANITIENDLDLVKGQEIVFIAYKLDANGDRTQTSINLGTYYVDNGNFDEYQNKYDFVSAENKYNINCPYIDFTNPYIVDQDKQSLNFAKLVNLEFTTAGFEAPLDVALESVGIEVSTDKNFVDYTQYTLISLLNMYNSFYCNVQDGFDGATSEELALPYDLASAGSPQKSYGDTSGIDFVNIKFKYVTSATELIPASEEDGTDAHNVITRQTADGSYYFNTQQQSETPIQGNGFTIEFPFPIGSANVSGADNAHSVLNSYSVGNMEHFLTAFANAYYPTASIGYVLSPEVYNRLNHNIMMYDVSAIDSETLADHLVDGYYQFDLDNPDDVALIEDITYPFTMMFMQYSISFDGSASISISSGNAWNVSSMSSSASSGSVSIIADASGNNVAQVMAMLGRIENRVKWWDKNGLNLNNFGSILANADYLNMGSKLFQDIQATTITTDYLKASEGNIDWLTVLNATIETAMIKDGAITHAKIGTEAVEASNIKDATITGAQIANSTITNANIANVSADKLTAGTIYTNNVTIQSQEGNFLISDNTLQIKDNNDTVRVQIGQTGASEPYDYDLILQDASGNIMWNASGLQENGVPNGLIKDVMVANNAAIQAGKLDIDSLFTVINNDNTNVIYGSKIYMNDEQASLSVVLSEIRSQIGDGSGEFYMNLTQPPTLYNYPANSWGEGGGSLYPDDYLYPSSNTYPDIEMYMGNVPYPSQYLYPNANGGGGSSSYQDHLGAKAYMTDSQGRVRSWMFDQDEQGNYYWRETTGTLDDVILQRLAVVEINTTEFESRFSEMGVTQDGIYNFWSMFHQDSSQIIQEVANERLISAINQTAEQVSINASKISLEGLVTVNGKFTIDRYGSMTATGGKIADFTITNNAIYNGTDSNTSTTKGVYVGKDGIRQYENANAYVDIKNGVLTAQGVNLSGSFNMTGGDINISSSSADTSLIELSSQGGSNETYKLSVYARGVNASRKWGVGHTPTERSTAITPVAITANYWVREEGAQVDTIKCRAEMGASGTDIHHANGDYAYYELTEAKIVTNDVTCFKASSDGIVENGTLLENKYIKVNNTGISENGVALSNKYLQIANFANSYNTCSGYVSDSVYFSNTDYQTSGWLTVCEFSIVDFARVVNIHCVGDASLSYRITGVAMPSEDYEADSTTIMHDISAVIPKPNSSYTPAQQKRVFQVKSRNGGNIWLVYNLAWIRIGNATL